MNEHEAKLLHTIERHAFQDLLRHKGTRQGQFDAHLLHFDHPLPGGGRMLEPSDGGAGAERLYAEIEVKPLWETLYAKSRKALKRRHRNVLDALAQDLRPSVAARIAGVGKYVVYRCLAEEFPPRFASAYRALKRWKAEK